MVDSIYVDYNGKALVNIHSEGSAYGDSSIEGTFLKDCEPIPLTPKILEKCGFEKLVLRGNNEDWEKQYDLDGVHDTGGYNVFYKIEDFMLAGLRDDDTSWALVYENAGYDEEAHIYTHKSGIDYLHQLQNLVYTLTGTELEVNL